MDKNTEYVISRKSEGLFKSKPLPLDDVFLSNIKCFRCKIGIQFNNTPSGV